MEGIMAIIPKKFKSKLRSDINTQKACSAIDLMWIEISNTFNNLKCSTLMCLCYVPHKNDRNDYVSEMNKMIELVNISSKHIIILGDLNINTKAVDELNLLKTFTDKHALKIINTKIPTRETKTSSTVIDHVIIDKMLSCENYVFNCDYGDHHTMVSNINYKFT